MAPAADMFDMGVELQVLKKGTMFPGRAKQLYELFIRYPSLEALPAETVAKLEKSTFKQPIAAVWAETVKFTLERLRTPRRSRAPRRTRSSRCRSSSAGTSASSNWANVGIPERASRLPGVVRAGDRLVQRLHPRHAHGPEGGGQVPRRATRPTCRCSAARASSAAASI